MTRCSTSSRRTSSSFRLASTVAVSTTPSRLSRGRTKPCALDAPPKNVLKAQTKQRAERDHEQDRRDGKYEVVEIDHRRGFLRNQR